MLKDGREVAVKIIYPCLRKELASDFSVFKTLGTQIRPGGFDLSWLVKDFEQALAHELDFVGEGKNSEECKRRLVHLPSVYVPEVVWEFTKSSVLTMEFVHGMVRLNDEQVRFACVCHMSTSCVCLCLAATCPHFSTILPSAAFMYTSGLSIQLPPFLLSCKHMYCSLEPLR